MTEPQTLATAVAAPEPPGLENPPARVKPLVLDVDGSGLPLLGLDPAPKTAQLRVISFGTRTGEAVDVLGDDLTPTSRGALTALPFANDVFDAVAVAGTLEHVVADDDALDELVRVIRPGGLLFLRVPQDDRFAWLDAQNLYTYLAGTFGNGRPLAGRPALKFRRHYGREELLDEFARRGLKARIVTTEGWGPAKSSSSACCSRAAGFSTRHVWNGECARRSRPSFGVSAASRRVPSAGTSR